MRLLPEEPNVQLREEPDGNRTVVLAFPYDGHLVAAVRTLPDDGSTGTPGVVGPADDWVGDQAPGDPEPLSGADR